SEYLDAVRSNAALMVDAAAKAGVDAPVPTCPEWTVADLAGHQGRVFRWMSAMVEAGAKEFIHPKPLDGAAEGGDPTAGIAPRAPAPAPPTPPTPPASGSSASPATGSRSPGSTPRPTPPSGARPPTSSCSSTTGGVTPASRCSATRPGSPPGGSTSVSDGVLR